MSLYFFADENVSSSLIDWIKEQGYTISAVKMEKLEGISDIKIIEKCFFREQHYFNA